MSPQKLIFCCTHVLHESALVQQIAACPDGSIQIACLGGDHSSDESRIWIHRHRVTDADPGVGEVLEGLARGHRAIRLGPAQPWVIEALATWRLADVVDRARHNPRTFHLPPASEREGLRVGDYAKLVFEGERGGDRMWVRVDLVEAGRYRGTLGNDPVYVEGIGCGEVVRFGPEHVCAVAREVDAGEAAGPESAPESAPEAPPHAPPEAPPPAPAPPARGGLAEALPRVLARVAQALRGWGR